MAPAFQLDALPAPIRGMVARALCDVDACEPAIEALERHVEAGGGADARIALALLTIHEAAELVLSWLEPAAARALRLIDEAIALGAPRTDGLARLRALCGTLLERERRRGRSADVFDPTGQAHRALLRGEHDALVAALLERSRRLLG